jgi:hypothetical protein
MTEQGKQTYSNDMKAQEAITHIQDNDFEELKGFVGKDEDRKTVKEAYGKKRHSRSNKAQVYEEWKDGQEELDKLHEAVDKAVKKTTIRGWVNGWKRGKKLPAVAKFYDKLNKMYH